MIIRIPRILATVIILIAYGGANAFGQTFQACGTAKSTKHAFTINGAVIHGLPLNANPPLTANQNGIANSSVVLYEAFANDLKGCAVASARTNIHGQFKMKFSNSPSPRAFLYLVTTSGNAGHGNNRNIKLMSVIKIGSALSSSSSSAAPVIGTINATVNELTTVSAAYVLSNFITNEIDIQDNTATFLSIDAQTINNLVDFQTGALGSVIQNSINHPFRLNMLANALWRCVTAQKDSVTNPFPNCSVLFAAASAPSSPNNTLGAIININKSPAGNVAAIYNLGSTGPYTPTSSQPNDWTLSVNYSLDGCGPAALQSIAIDRIGDVWVTNFCGSVTELASNGTPLSPSGGFVADLSEPAAIAIDTTGNAWIGNYVEEDESFVANVVRFKPPTLSPPNGISVTFLSGQISPEGIAIDGNGSIWVSSDFFVDSQPGSLIAAVAAPPSPSSTRMPAALIKLDGNGDQMGKSPFFPKSLSEPAGLAVDGSNNVWSVNTATSISSENATGSVTEVDNSGVEVSGSPFPTNPLDFPAGIAIDPSNNVWIAENGGVAKLTAAGQEVTGSPFSAGGQLAGFLGGLAVDGSGNVWVPNPNSEEQSEPSLTSTLVELGPSGGPLSGTNGFTNEYTFGLEPVYNAIDSGGNVWVAYLSDPFVTTFIGVASPVTTPLIGLPQMPTLPLD